MLNVDSLKLIESSHCRPGFDTRGAKIELTANYVELLPSVNMVLHRYHVATIPETAGKKPHRILQVLLQSAELTPHQGKLATDFRSTLLSKPKFKHDEGIVEIQYRWNGEERPVTGSVIYKVRVRFTKSLSIDELVNRMNYTGISQPSLDKEKLTQALNIFFKLLRQVRKQFCHDWIDEKLFSQPNY
jgi:eukaryotic translation initiation factor 2C